ncbi:MAG: TonB-dependent receptor [Tannerella sp.]|jgi:iron complex outermembrane receptor protein|nr:TonB-dependent receptor [Tannerella sp.]
MEQVLYSKAAPVHFKRFVHKRYAVFNSLHKVVNIGVVAGCVLTALQALPAQAQTAGETSNPGKMPDQQLDEVTVTASQLLTPLNQTAKLVTVITREDIQRAQVQSIADLLTYAANVDVVQRGGHGVQADISIRGGSFDQNAILLNGVNLSSSQTGHYNLDIPINLSDIERIEIIHGPSALVYGAGAFSGGINIITKKDAAERLYAKLESGMHAERNLELRGSARMKATVSSLSLGYNASDGYRHNTDYAIGNALWQTRLYLPAESGKLDFQLGYNRKQYGANAFYTAAYPDQYEHTSALTASVRGELGRGRLKVVPILYWSRRQDRFDLIKGSTTGRNYHRNDNYGANLIASLRWAGGLTSLGGEWRREGILSSKLGLPMDKPEGHYTNKDGRTNASLTLEHTLVLGDWSAEAGALLYHTTLLPGKYALYPSASLSYRPVDAWKFSASWSRSTRLPTFTDLYYTTVTHTANETLRPERSESLDAGIHYGKGRIQAYLSSFLLWSRDVIDWVKPSADKDAKWESWNLTKVDTRGVEAGVLFQLGRQTRLAVDYARMFQSSDTHGFISQYALNYLRDKLGIRLNHPLLKHLDAGWYFRWQKRMGEPAQAAYSTLDLKLRYHLGKIGLHLDLANLYDTHYADRTGVIQPGFWLTGGLSYTLY